MTEQNEFRDRVARKLVEHAEGKGKQHIREICRPCGGRGRVCHVGWEWVVCPDCNGKGQVTMFKEPDGSWTR